MSTPTTIKAENTRALAAEKALSDRIAKLETPVPQPPPPPPPPPTEPPPPPPVITPTTIYGHAFEITGGAGKPQLVCQTRDEFVNAVARSDADILVKTGTYDLTAQTFVKGHNVTVTFEDVTLKGHTFYIADGATNILVRNMRQRAGWAGGQDADGVTIARGCDLIAFDHFSVSNFYDEGIDVWSKNRRVTLQHGIFGAGGDPAHAYANMVQEESLGVSIFACVYAGDEYRNPAIGWKDQDGAPLAPGLVADIASIYSSGSRYGVTVYRGGTANVRNSIMEDGYDLASNARMYASGNVNTSGADLGPGNVSTPYPVPAGAELPVIPVSQLRAYLKANAGAFPRDALDTQWLSAIPAGG